MGREEAAYAFRFFFMKSRAEGPEICKKVFNHVV